MSSGVDHLRTLMRQKSQIRGALWELRKRQAQGGGPENPHNFEWAEFARNRSVDDVYAWLSKEAPTHDEAGIVLYSRVDATIVSRSLK